MRINIQDFQVVEGSRVSVAKFPTRVKPFYESQEDYKRRIHTMVGKLSARQERFYAGDRHALLIILQAMDAGGKDGVIKHVMSGVNPQGCNVTSFKHPSTEELDHDFLWRSTRFLPERGMIGVFNRSYYEEVLIARVHPEILQAQNIPTAPSGHEKVWKNRFQSIVDFEGHMGRNGTKIVKIFLHISKDEQRKRLLARIDDVDKNWKFNASDLEGRAHWHDYMKAYEACLQATSTRAAPWYVVPADDKHNARLIVSRIVLEAMKSVSAPPPLVTAERLKELAEFRAQLEE